MIRALIEPARHGMARTRTALVAFWCAAILALWLVSPYSTLPSPREVFAAIGELWLHDGLGPELARTLGLIAEATLLTVAVSLPIAYATALPMLRPLALGTTKLRFLSLTGLVVPLTLATGGGAALKLTLLTFGMSVFYVTAMARIVAEVPEHELEAMRVLGASRWRIAWETLVLGTLDRAVDALRQNVAMGWSMITMVEGISRADGGLGALLLSQHKHFRLAHVFAILLVVLAVGLVIDAGMALLGALVAPPEKEGAKS